VPAYGYNFVGLNSTTIASKDKLQHGKATILFEFAYDGGLLGKDGMAMFFVDDKNTGCLLRGGPQKRKER
jgi:hypothetical protein